MPVQKVLWIMAIFMNYETIHKKSCLCFFGVTWQASQLVAPGHSGAWFTRWFTAAGAVLGFSIADGRTDWKLEVFFVKEKRCKVGNVNFFLCVESTHL